MQTTDKATPSHESNRGSRSQSGARFQLLSDKATPSHEVKSACQPHGWRTFFDLTSAKVIIFFKFPYYSPVFFHQLASHFRHNIKIRYPSIIFGEFLLIA